MELFTVHKELICSSDYFRNILQPRRKAIVDKDECSICHEALNRGVKELTYCTSSCGTNFHRSCMDEWKQIGSRGPLRCPMCRSVWKQPRAETFYRLLAFEPEAFDIYIEWLYKSSITISPDDEYEVSSSRLIAAYILSHKIGEPKFGKAILQAMVPVCVNKFRPSADLVSRIYKVTCAAPRRILRKYFVCVHMELNDEEHSNVLANWNKYPATFRKDLTRAMMRERAKGVGTRDLDALKQKIINDDWDMDEEDEEEENQSSEEDNALSEDEAIAQMSDAEIAQIQAAAFTQRVEEIIARNVEEVIAQSEEVFRSVTD